MTKPTTEHLQHRLLCDSVTVAPPCAQRLRPRGVLRALIILAIAVIAGPSPRPGRTSVPAFRHGLLHHLRHPRRQLCQCRRAQQFGQDGR
jgi:hypothetical protein